MTEAKPGQWVLIHRVLLAPGERAPRLPAETASVPLEMRVRGFLSGDRPARVGEAVTVRTLAGRFATGTLLDGAPAWMHGFGPPVPALLEAGEELAALARELAEGAPAAPAPADPAAGVPGGGPHA